MAISAKHRRLKSLVLLRRLRFFLVCDGYDLNRKRVVRVVIDSLLRSKCIKGVEKPVERVISPIDMYHERMYFKCCDAFSNFSTVLALLNQKSPKEFQAPRLEDGLFFQVRQVVP
jgi:hypothetical protein